MKIKRENFGPLNPLKRFGAKSDSNPISVDLSRLLRGYINLYQGIVAL